MQGYRRYKICKASIAMVTMEILLFGYGNTSRAPSQKVLRAYSICTINKKKRLKIDDKLGVTERPMFTHMLDVAT